MSTTHVHEHTACFHCGQACEEDLIREQDKSFCCQGCHTVYQLLQSHDLTTYYQLNNKPGVQQKAQASRQKLAYLDDETVRQKLVDFTDGTTTRISFYLPQIHCSSCIWLLEKLPVLHTGISAATVNFMKREVYVTFQEAHISIRELVELLINIGYEPLINLEAIDKEHRKKETSTQTRSFYVKLGVTGFCFGNIMLLSFPEYLGITELDKQYAEMFGYLNLLLSLPVFFYGASGYFVSAWNSLRHRGLNIDVPLALGILALFGRSAYEILSGTDAGYLDSLGALIFLLLVGKWFQQKTFDNISFERDYRSYFPIAISTVREGEEQTIPISKLEEGDVLRVRNGELIPADAILLRGEAHIDYSFVTGESKPVARKSGDLIYAGGKQVGGMIELQMVKEVSQSYLTRLWNDQHFKDQGHKRMANFTNTVSHYFTIIIMLVASGSAAYWWGQSPELAINTFTAVLIIACPCALALNVPFSLGNALRILARHGLYVKDTDSVERMHYLTQVVFDKTGTITATDKESVRFVGQERADLWPLVSALTAQSTHPINQQLTAFLGKAPKGLKVEGFKEVAGNGIEGRVDGLHIRLGKASFAGAPAAEAPQFQTVSYLSVEGQVLGHFALQQTLRPGVRQTIQALKGRYGLSLLSGDNEGERARLQEVFGAGCPLRFQQSPQDKMDYIYELQQQGQKVLMLGDGLNDAGALKRADVGVAVADNVHQFSPACDAILQASEVGRFEQLLAFARNSLWVTRTGFLFSLAYNLVGLWYAVQGDLSPIVAAILMPISSATIVACGMIGTTLLGRKLKR